MDDDDTSSDDTSSDDTSNEDNENLIITIPKKPLTFKFGDDYTIGEVNVAMSGENGYDVDISSVGNLWLV